MSGIAFAGRYEGSGVWYDEAGKSQTYTVVQTNTATSDGFEVAFKHCARAAMRSRFTARARRTLKGLYIAWRESLRRTA